MSVLYPLDAVRDRHDGLQPFLQLRWDDGLDVRLLLEDEAREQCDDLLGIVRGERVLEDEFGEDELVGRVDLRAVVAN